MLNNIKLQLWKMEGGGLDYLKWISKSYNFLSHIVKLRFHFNRHPQQLRSEITPEIQETYFISDIGFSLS
jgi:hypothetical protein